jgi:hypothetical protein
MKRIFNTQLKMFSKFIFCLALFPAVGLAAVTFISQMNGTLNSIDARLQQLRSTCTANEMTGVIPQECFQIPKAESAVTKLRSAVNAYSTPQTLCTSSAAGSEGLCSTVLSPGVKNVQKLLTAGQAAIGATTSAADTCEKSSNLMSKAQTAMTAASVACSAIKLTCDKSCASSAAQLNAMTPVVSEIELAVQGSASALNAHISTEQTTVTAKITGCQKHEVSLVDMGTQAVGLYLAAKDSQSCKEEISQDPKSTGGAAPAGAAPPPPEEAVTTEMCADVAIAAVPVCKCKADPKGQGCSGILADNKNPATIKSVGKGSQLAGLGSFKQSGKISGLNSATEADLNAGIDPNSSNANLNSDSGAATAADISAGKMGSAADALDKTTAGKDKAKLGSGGIGSFGGGGSSGGGNKSENKVFSDGQIADAKRQIAAERLQAEVSTASGKSNWEKISTRYVENKHSFYGK